MYARGFLLALLAGCGPGLTATQVKDDEVDEGDTTAPEIAYTQEEDWAPLGEPIVIEATITDAESTVYIATLAFKQETGEWQTRAFMQGEGDVWTATIPADDLGSAGIYYYIEAVDTAQNVAYAPEDGEADPYHLRLSE